MVSGETKAWAVLGLGSGLGDMSRSGIPFVKCVTLIALGPGEKSNTFVCVIEFDPCVM